MRINVEGNKLLSSGKQTQLYICKIVPQHTLFLENLTLGLIFTKSEHSFSEFQATGPSFLGEKQKVKSSYQDINSFEKIRTVSSLMKRGNKTLNLHFKKSFTSVQCDSKCY